MQDSPSITVLVRTYNSEKTLAKVLSALDLRKGDECIIVDSGSKDGTLALAAKHKAKILRSDPPFNYSRSLNMGFAAAKGDWVMVLSSHCIPLRFDLVARMRELAAQSTPFCAVIYGTVLFYDKGVLPVGVLSGSWDAWQTNPKLQGGNGFALYPRNAWERRPFDETLPTAEDYAWLQQALLAGYEAAVVTDAAVLYRNQGGLIYMFKKGWHETLNAMAIRSGFTGGKSWFQALRSFTLNALYLTKVFILGRCGPGAYLRMLAHGLGAALAGSSGRKLLHQERPKV